jgi:hypothetical protein
MKHNKATSTYTQYILNTRHTYRNIQNSTEIIQITRKLIYMNSLEKFKNGMCSKEQEGTKKHQVQHTCASEGSAHENYSNNK